MLLRGRKQALPAGATKSEQRTAICAFPVIPHRFSFHLLLAFTPAVHFVRAAKKGLVLGLVLFISYNMTSQ